MNPRFSQCPLESGARAAAHHRPQKIDAQSGAEKYSGPTSLTACKQQPLHGRFWRRGFWRRLLTLPLALVWMATANAALADRQSGEFQFWESPATDALPQKVVKQTIQDNTGAMWFVTLEGLSRYDGHGVTNFPTESALGGGSIKGIDLDTKGQLWVITDRRLLRFDQTLQRFVPARHLPAGIRLHALTAGRNGTLWLGTGNGVGIYRPESQRYEAFGAVDKLGEGSPVVDILLTDDGRQFALFEGRGLFELSATEPPRPLINAEQGRHAEFWMVEQVGDALWVATQGAGILTVDLEDGAVDRIVADGQEGLLSDVIYHILADESGVWVSTADGLLHRSRETNLFKAFASSPDELLGDITYFVARSLDGSYWVSTFHGLVQGLHLPFRHIALSARGQNQADNDVNAVLVDPRGSLWIASAAGLHHRPPQALQFRTINHATHPILEDDVIMSLARGGEVLWIGTFDAGLYRYLPEQDEMSAIPVDPDDPKALHASGITAILVHSSGQVVVATYGGGISVLDADGRVMRSLDLPKKSASPETALALLEDRDGSVLIGSSAGLLRLNRELSSLAWLTFNSPVEVSDAPGEPVQTLDFPVWELTHGKSGELWLGTYNHGLLHWIRDNNGETAGIYDLSDELSLPSRTVLGIHFGVGDDLWLSHNSGLTRLNTLTLTVEHFGAGFGDDSINFNMGASFRADDGTLYFGSDQGVRVLPPSIDNLERPAVGIGIASIEVMGRRIPVPNSMEPLALRLGHSDTLTTITFFSTDFTSPKNNAYAYRLVGLDNKWIQLGNGRSLNLNRLPSGQYTLELSVRDSAGNWHPAARRIALTVEPPWWQSILAYAVYSLLLTLFVRFLFWVRYNYKLARKYRALEAALHPDNIPLAPDDTEDAALREAKRRSSMQ